MTGVLMEVTSHARLRDAVLGIFHLDPALSPDLWLRDAVLNKQSVLPGSFQNLALSGRKDPFAEKGGPSIEAPHAFRPQPSLPTLRGPPGP
jgi:hypothetical protein